MLSHVHGFLEQFDLINPALIYYLLLSVLQQTHNIDQEYGNNNFKFYVYTFVCLYNGLFI